MSLRKLEEEDMTTTLINQSTRIVKSFLSVVLIWMLLGLPAYAADNGDFTVIYDGSSNPRHHEYISLLQGQQFFEKIASDLNSTLALPRDIPIVLGECNVVNAGWLSDDSVIVICYELIDSFYDTFTWIENSSQERLDNLVLGNLEFTFYHELAHALIDLYDLSNAFPMREEDNADQLATVLLIQKDDAGAALSAAFSFGVSNAPTPQWDVHSLDEQRAYNIKCLVYGSDPARYESMVLDGSLPIERAPYCPEEYEQVMNGWANMLEQYVSFLEESTPYGSEETSAQQVYRVTFRLTTGDAGGVMVIAGNQALLRTTFLNETGQQEQVDQVMTRQLLPDGSGYEYRGTTPTYADTDIPHPSYQPDIVYLHSSGSDSLNIEIVDAVDGRRFQTEITNIEAVN